MESPRRALLLLGVFILSLFAGLSVGGLWHAADLAAPTTASSPADGDQDTPQVAFEGIVHYISGDVPASWLVDRYAFQVITTTRVISNGLPITPGVWAQVEAIKQQEGLVATTVALRPSPTSSLYDRITVMDAGSQRLHVGTTQIELSTTTQIQGTPAVGRLAYVTGRRSADGIVADEIVVDDSAPDTVVIGTLTLITGTTWLVDNVTVQIDATTVISGTPSVGREVQVLGFEAPNRTLQATQAWVSDDLVEEQTLVAWLQRIEGQRYPYLWRINRLDGPRLRQVYLSVYEDVVLDDSAGTAVPGVWLEVVAMRQHESVYRAESIVVLPRAPKLDIIGLVEAMPPSGLTGRWRVAGYQVEVSGHTAILGTPQLGSLVRVQGTPDTAYVLHAELVDVQGD